MAIQNSVDGNLTPYLNTRNTVITSDKERGVEAPKLEEFNASSIFGQERGGTDSFSFNDAMKLGTTALGSLQNYNSNTSAWTDNGAFQDPNANLRVYDPLVAYVNYPASASPKAQENIKKMANSIFLSTTEDDIIQQAKAELEAMEVPPDKVNEIIYGKGTKENPGLAGTLTSPGADGLNMIERLQISYVNKRVANSLQAQNGLTEEMVQDLNTKAKEEYEQTIKQIADSVKGSGDEAIQDDLAKRANENMDTALSQLIMEEDKNPDNPFSQGAKILSAYEKSVNPEQNLGEYGDIGIDGLANRTSFTG
ncbi:MAG: hypothetical protein MK033_06515 [Candidatus Caenarcaniphilales bacterium]|nr:hypothetical protein [Candidatus Caenarcaniphilales bacterium]